VVELNQSMLIDVDWREHRERERVKKEIRGPIGTARPNKIQVTSIIFIQ
jgi:hypothetical protein